jgi:hypothetical protein
VLDTMTPETREKFELHLREMNALTSGASLPAPTTPENHIEH